MEVTIVDNEKLEKIMGKILLQLTIKFIKLFNKNYNS